MYVRIFTASPLKELIIRKVKMDNFTRKRHMTCT